MARLTFLQLIHSFAPPPHQPVNQSVSRESLCAINPQPTNWMHIHTHNYSPSSIYLAVSTNMHSIETDRQTGERHCVKGIKRGQRFYQRKHNRASSTTWYHFANNIGHYTSFLCPPDCPGLPVTHIDRAYSIIITVLCWSMKLTSARLCLCLQHSIARSPSSCSGSALRSPEKRVQLIYSELIFGFPYLVYLEHHLYNRWQA